MASERSTQAKVSPKVSSSNPAGPVPQIATVLDVEPRGEHLGVVTLGGHKLGAQVQAGQFCMLWRPERASMRAGSEVRPFAYFAAPSPDVAQFLVRERAEGPTTLLMAPRGTQVPFVGPLGRGFPPRSGAVWAVAGGVGAAALGSLLPPPPGSQLRLILGLRHQAEAGIEAALRQRATGPVRLDVIHEEGPQGGTVLALLQREVALASEPPSMLLGCGPEPMLRALAAYARGLGVGLWVSVNTALPCGVGRCGQCVLHDHAGQRHLACVDGPIYPGELLFGAGV